jgi:site-specific recombinase XerD
MRQQYSPLSGRNLLRVAAHVSRWLASRRLQPSDLSAQRAVEFCAHRRRKGYTQFLTPRALQPLLGYLRARGITPQPDQARVMETPLERLLREYEEYLVGERGLVSKTIRSHTRCARQFVAAHGGLDWRRLRPAEVIEFVLRDSRKKSVGYCKFTVTGLRSLLRFLHVRGRINRDLSSCVPAVAGWRLASLPRALEADQVQRLLRSCDTKSAVGVRDAAIVRMLVRLGLRAGELAALQLDDIDWRAGEILVRGKGRRESRLPLPHDVGRAVATYLRRGRPTAETRQVFVRSRAPFHALSTGSVSAAATRALRRVNVLAGGAHLLRHTAATQMLRRGASLSEIGHVLRHRHIDTTAIYAKVDDNKLRVLAQPWPGGAA